MNIEKVNIPAVNWYCCNGHLYSVKIRRDEWDNNEFIRIIERWTNDGWSKIVDYNGDLEEAMQYIKVFGDLGI